MDWQNKKVLIVGMARSGIAAAQLLHGAGAVVTVNDMKPESAFGDKLDALRGLDISFRLGEDGLDALRGQDILCISPGVPIDAPIVKAAKAARTPWKPRRRNAPRDEAMPYGSSDKPKRSAAKKLSRHPGDRSGRRG